ncbi:MAG: HAMP domain-containing histidine kinase [Acidobacteria bacterium]|nr:HAMP domain-containing histidine kinase [Acidobacteriota bacterium]
MPSSLNAGLVGARRADVRLAVVSLGLAAALGVIGWWQYRSVSDASAAEHDRMQALLASRAAQFERDLDRELTRAFVWLQVDAPSASGEPRRSLPGRLARWYDESPHPELLESIYVVRSAEAGPGAAQAAPSTFRFDRDATTLVEAPLPPELQHLRERFAERDRERDREGGFGGRRFRFGPPIDPVGPALVVGRPWFRRNRVGDGDAPAAAPGGRGRSPAAAPEDPEHDVVAILALLDTAYLAQTLLPAIAAEHFPVDERFAFRLRVTRVADEQPLFTWPRDTATVDFSRPDATVDLLRLRIEDFSRFMLTRPNGEGAAAAPPGGEPPPDGDRIQITVLPREAAAPPDPARSEAMVIGAPDGRRAVWRLALVHRDGSLDEAVARTRRWNLAASLGMLLILAAGMGVVLVASRRAQRLAHERLEFVAGVSHELRTPLSVIRSAAENLADGVVADGAQVQRYGQLIASEGRRLSMMVDDVMAFAGMERTRGSAEPQLVAVAEVIDTCLARVRDDVAAAGLTLDVTRPPSLPFVQGDPDALVRALVNLVTNAIKYAADGGWIGLAADVTRERGRAFVRLTVSDRGPGIDQAERARVFEPFFRGADAMTRQIHGNGLGLSLVQRTVAGHGGRVMLGDNAPTGCVFTILLPVATAAAAAPATVGDEAPAAR